MDAIKIFLKLPSVIMFDGVEFELKLFNNHGEGRLVYAIEYVEKTSKHYRSWKTYNCWLNPFYGNGEYKSFLVLIEDVDSVERFSDSVKLTRRWLKKNGLIKGK